MVKGLPALLSPAFDGYYGADINCSIERRWGISDNNGRTMQPSTRDLDGCPDARLMAYYQIPLI